jgi:hypothetical protein
MNDITIMYKTFGPDLPFLKYSLLSVKKFVKNYKEIIIYCHDDACADLYVLLKEINLDITIIPVEYDFHGYIKQMVVKCECYKHVNTKYIVIFDSDNIVKDYLDLNSLVGDNGKITWVYSNKLDSPTNIEWVVWKKAYEEMTKTKQDIHFMTNSFPFIFTRDSLEKAEHLFKAIHNKGYSDFCKDRLNRRKISKTDSIKKAFPMLAEVFEEFEWLGFYCKKYSNDYIFINNKEGINPAKDKIIQYWSHGGLTDDIRREIDKIIQI